MRVVTCKLCGEEFEYEGRGHVQYCGEECRAKAEKINDARQRENRRNAKKKKRQKNENDQAIIEIARKARAMGMSYGQYVAYWM